MFETSKYVKPWRAAIAAAVKELTDGETVFDRGRPLAVSVTFYVKRPRKPQHVPGLGQFPLPISTPDLDKLLRSTMDGMTESGVWADDAQVVLFSDVSKVYATTSEPPGAEISVWETAVFA